MRHVYRVFLLSLILVIAAACGGDDTPDATVAPTLTAIPSATVTPSPTITPTPWRTPTAIPMPRTIALDPADQAYLRMVHAAPGVEAVDFFVDGLTVAAGLSYERNTAPTGLTAGQYTLRVVANGDPDSTLIEQSLDVPGGQTLILLLTGTADAPQITIHTEATAPLAADTSRVMLIHAMPDGPAVSVRSAGREIAPAINFTAATMPIEVASGPISLELVNGEEALLVYPTEFAALRSYTLILTGTADAPVTIMVESRVPGVAQLRTINAAPPTGSIDLYLDGEPLAAAVDFPRSSPREQVAAGSHIVTVYSAGADPAEASPLAEEQINLRTGDIYTLFVVSAENDTLRLVTFEDDLSPLPQERARLRYFNAAADVPLMRLGASTMEDINLPDVSFGQLSRPLLVEPGTYNLSFERVENRTTGDTVETSEGIQIDAGREHIFLVTARGLEQAPIVFIEDVGIEAAAGPTPEDPDATAMPTATAPTRVRFVHAIDGAGPINVLFNGIAIASELEARQSTAFTVVMGAGHVIEVSYAGAEGVVASLDHVFEQPGDYAIYVHGFVDDLVGITVTPDPRLQEQDGFAQIRLVNLTMNSSEDFGLGYVESSGGSIPGPTIDEETGNVFRPSLFAGVNQIAREVDAGAASPADYIATGAYDFIVITPDEGTIAGAAGNVTLEENRVYDVIAFQELYTRALRTFVVVTPDS